MSGGAAGPEGASEEGASPRSEVVAGAAFALLGAAMWYGARDLVATIPGTYVGPGLLPRICAAGFLFLGLCLCGRGLASLWGSRRGASPAASNWRSVAGFAVPVTLVLVWWLAPVVGFLTMTALAGVTLMRLRGGSWTGSLLTAALLAVAVHILFTNVMRIQMPYGFFY